MLMARALSALAIMTVGNIPMYLRRRCLSMVRICSNNIIEFLSRPSKSLIKVCVGSFAFVCTRLVIGAIMTVSIPFLPFQCLTIALKEQVAHRLINKRNIHTKQSKAFP